MEKRDRKPGYFARLKRRRPLKQSQPEKNVNEPSPAIISCPDNLNGSDLIKKAESQRATAKSAASLGDGCKSNNQAKMEKKRPPGTVEFTVGPDDTLNSIALKFNITPNKLVQLNKLFSRSVYPSQKLFVPDVSHSEADLKSQSSSDPSVTDESTQDGISNCRSANSIRRQLSPNSEDESPATVRFIKMSCKYFTDGMGVVGGVLIVTPNNIMFDPHKSDPVVIEHGCEEYGLICPMEEVVSVALYDDVSRMKLKDTLPSDPPQDLCPVYRPGEWEQLPSERELNPFSRYEAMDPKRAIVLDDIESALSEIGNAQSEEMEKSPSDEGFTELEPTINGTTEEKEGSSCETLGSVGTDQRELVGPSGPRQRHPLDKLAPSQSKGKLDEEEDEGVAQNCSIEDGESIQASSETERRADSQDKPTCQEVTKTKDIKSRRPEELLFSIDNKIIGTPVDQNGKRSLEEASQVCGQSGSTGQSPSRPDEEEKLSEEERNKSWLLERIQAPIQDMLFSSEEKSKNPPMFLCFKVGKPMRKSFATALTSSPAHLFGGRGKQPEYWFAVPQERVNDLYAFFVQWSPDVYGKEAREQGFVVVEKDELDMIDNFFSDPASCSWEIITIDEAKRRQSFGSCDGDLAVDSLPLLSDSSDLLQDTHIEKLACRLPARVQGYPWRLTYSTEKHGTSLKTLYRNLADVDSPVLLVIKDMDNQIFGAFSTHPFRVSEHCYGTGETFLYSFCPEIKVYRWTGENSYFVKGNTDSLQMGGGGGQLGLWLDAELYRGTTTKCATFNNQPLSSQQDFNIHSLEVWTFE